MLEYDSAQLRTTPLLCLLEVEGEVGSEDGTLGEVDELAILVLTETLEDVVAVHLGDGHKVVEVVILHRGGAVQVSQGTVGPEGRKWG